MVSAARESRLQQCQQRFEQASQEQTPPHQRASAQGQSPVLWPREPTSKTFVTSDVSDMSTPNMEVNRDNAKRQHLEQWFHRVFICTAALRSALMHTLPCKHGGGQSCKQTETVAGKVRASPAKQHPSSQNCQPALCAPSQHQHVF